MARYIFYTVEGSTQSPNGELVENCQMLGYSTGENAKKALQRLLADNRWIESAGYNPSEILCARVEEIYLQ